MKILKTDAVSLKKAVFLLRNGGVIVYPTDTAYGLGCDALNKKAVKKIYKIKNRPAGKPLPAIIGSLALAKKFFKFTPQELALAKKYWPGPLSLLLQIRSPSYPSPHPSPLERGRVREGVWIAVRVPDSKVARRLSSKLQKPIISTSANLSGMGECYGVKDVLKQFGVTGQHIILRPSERSERVEKFSAPRSLSRCISGLRSNNNLPDLVLDAGKLKKRKPSTIIRVINGKIEVLRKGPVRISNF